MVYETGFSCFCESSEFGNTEFELGRSWGLGYKAVLRVWVGVPSGPDSRGRSVAVAVAVGDR